MQTPAWYLDVTLVIVSAATFALVLYKALSLWTAWFTPHRAPATTVTAVESRTEQMESGLVVLAVVVTAAPLLGLAGTVLHIMDALRSLTGSGLDTKVLAGPIASALRSTLFGMASAIPAAIAHALFERRVQLLHNRAMRELEAEQ